jgi:hypothetical protein
LCMKLCGAGRPPAKISAMRWSADSWPLNFFVELVPWFGRRLSVKLSEAQRS